MCHLLGPHVPCWILHIFWGWLHFGAWAWRTYAFVLNAPPYEATLHTLSCIIVEASTWGGYFTHIPILFWWGHPHMEDIYLVFYLVDVVSISRCWHMPDGAFIVHLLIALWWDIPHEEATHTTLGFEIVVMWRGCNSISLLMDFHLGALIPHLEGTHMEGIYHSLEVILYQTLI